MKRSTTLLAALFSLAALAGCSDMSGGNAKPETTSPPTSATSDSTGTPSGPELSLAKFLEKPCDVLTPTQVAPFGNFKAPALRKAPLGPSCRWSAQDVTTDPSFSVTLADGQEYDTLLSNSRKDPVFSEQKVDGRRAFSSDDTDGTVDCATTVETGKTSAILVQISVYAGKKPCDEAQKVAAAVISTLRG